MAKTNYMPLDEALYNCGQINKYATVTPVGVWLECNVETVIVDDYVVYMVNHKKQKYSNTEYFNLTIMYARWMCESFVDGLKSHQKGIYNGMTRDEICAVYSEYSASKIDCYIASCIRHGLLEHQGDLYAW